MNLTSGTDKLKKSVYGRGFEYAEFNFNHFESLTWPEVAQNGWFLTWPLGWFLDVSVLGSNYIDRNGFNLVLEDAEFKFDHFKSVTWPKISQNGRFPLKFPVNRLSF